MGQRFRFSLPATLALAAFITLLLPLGVRAQPVPLVPNASFETWSSRSVNVFGAPVTYRAPDDWDLGFLSTLLLAFGGTPPRLSQSPIAHGGSSSLQITVGPDSSGADVVTAFPTTQTARAVTAWVRNSSVVSNPEDAGFCVVFFTRTVGGQSDTVAIAGSSLNAAAANAWQQLVLPVVPLQAVTPDTAVVYVGLYQGVPGFDLRVDEIAFSNSAPTGLAAAAPVSSLALYPNPVARLTDGVTVTVPARTTGLAVLTITDVTGRAAGRVRTHTLAPGDNTLPVPTTGLPAGAYVVRVLSADGTRSSRLVIE